MIKQNSDLLTNCIKSLPFLIGLLTGLCFFTFQVTGFSLSYFPGDFGDGRFNIYILEHAYKFFSGQVTDYWSAPFMFPEPNVISYSDNLLGTAPIYALFRSFGSDIFTAFQLWFICLTILNYSAAYVFLLKVFKNRYAAVLGAMVFAFSIALQSQLTHAQTFPRFPIPLAFLMAYYFRNSLRPKHFFFCVLLVVYQIYCAIYLGLMLMVPVAIFLIIIFGTNWRKIKTKNRKWYFHLIGYLMLNALMLLPLMQPYMKRSGFPSMEYFRQIFHTIPSIQSHFYSQKGSILWDFLAHVASEYPASWNHQIFAGGIASIAGIVFAISVLYKRFFAKRNQLGKKSISYQFFLTALFSKILFLRIGIISAYLLIFFLPGFSAMRSITRIINVELLFFAFACSYVFSFVLNKKHWKNFLLMLLFLALFVMDNYLREDMIYRKEKKVAVQRSANLIDLMSHFPENSIVSYEPTSKLPDVFIYQLDAMLASQATDNISINAYTATSPPEYTNYWNFLDASSRMEWLDKKILYRDSLYIINSAEQYYLLSGKGENRKITAFITAEEYFLVNKENPYSPTMKLLSEELPVGGKKCFISVNGLTATINPSVHGVISLEKNGEKLFYKGFPLVQSSGDWYNYYFEIDFPEEIPLGSELKIYVWNPSTEDFFIDKMNIQIE